MFTYSNIYYYQYAPVTLPNLPFYDRYPLMIPFNIMGATMTGINMHFIPRPLQLKFMQVMMEMQSKSYNPKMFRLWYNNIKYNPALSFVKVAIRKYYISHCYNVQIIPQEEWIDLPKAWGSRYRARYMRRSISNPLIHI